MLWHSAPCRVRVSPGRAEKHEVGNIYLSDLDTLICVGAVVDLSETYLLDEINASVQLADAIRLGWMDRLPEGFQLVPLSEGLPEATGSRVCLISACWGGDRRDTWPLWNTDRSVFLKSQVYFLSKIQHHLSRIVFANNICQNESKQYRKALSSLPRRIQGAEVVLIEKPNYGMSYGLWEYVYDLYKKEFDYFIFNEDDYVYVLNDFDRKLINVYRSIKDGGYLCQLAAPNLFASVSNGIASSRALRVVCERTGGLGSSHDTAKATDYDHNQSAGQITWGAKFISAGLGLWDYSDYYNAPFWEACTGKEFWHKGGPDKRPIISMPVQIMSSTVINRITTCDTRKKMATLNSPHVASAKVNLVIACWGGNRRGPDPVYDKDRGRYIKTQVKQLRGLNHNLQQITFANNIDPDERPDYRAVLESLPDMIGSARVKVFEKPNFGMSYALFDHVYKLYKDDFDYYIFIEDDRVFVLDDFDAKLVTLYDGLPKCGYLCGMVGTPPDNPQGLPFGSITEGIAHQSVLADICLKFGRLGHNSDPRKATHYPTNEVDGQIAFGQSFVRAGYRIYDIAGNFNLPFWNSLDGRTDENPHRDATDPVIMRPIQLLGG